jgi:mono/diheme cytochrome c family protein
MAGRGWAVAITVGLLLAGTVGPSPAQPLFGPSQDPMAGSRVFGVKGCIKCHAVEGVGGNVGPDLGRIPRPRTFFDLAAALWNHAPRMADRMRQLGIPRPQLDARETGDLVAFLYTANYFESPGRPEIGRRLFTDKRCVVCHQIGGTGGVIGPSLDGLKRHGSPIFVATAMWNHGPQMAEVMRSRGIPRPTFSDDELRDLLAYVYATSQVQPDAPLYVLPGRPDEGRRSFVEKRCADCHSAGGQGGRIGPDLAERGVHRTLNQFAQAMWNKGPAMMDAMRGRSIPVPTIRPEEMADIVAYLYSVRYFAQAGDPKKGGAVATYKGCLSCHGLYGERGRVAVDLSKARGLDSPAGVMAGLWNHSFITDPRPERDRAAWAEVRADEMADLIAFLQSLGRRR